MEPRIYCFGISMTTETRTKVGKWKGGEKNGRRQLNEYRDIALDSGREYAEFKLTDGTMAWCDPENKPFLLEYGWQFIEGRGICTHVKMEDGSMKNISFERLVMEAEDGVRIYVIENERDVRKSNLRTSAAEKVVVENLPVIPHADAAIASRVELVWYGVDIGVHHGGSVYEMLKNGKPVVVVVFQPCQDLSRLYKTFSLFRYETMEAAWKAARLFTK